ncbi:hypothetical protein, partial [Klebsiella pneumoniae]|uniref:hypothetical protein n=1 Tax=Klebsiella pneumoniae TaxID=573 RepID=UPI002163430A
LMMSLWDALRMNMMISYQELVRTFPKRVGSDKSAACSSRSGTLASTGESMMDCASWQARELRYPEE